MDSILNQLYNGQIYPAEQYRPLLKEYKEIHEQYNRHYKILIDKIKKINPSLEEEFTAILDRQLHVSSLELSQMFIDGFRLGAQMMIEVFENKHNTSK